MAWDEWVDLASAKALSQHTSATLFAFLCSWLIALAARHMELADWAREIIDTIEQVVLVGLIGWFVVQMAFVLWKGRIRHDVKDSLDAA